MAQFEPAQGQATVVLYRPSKFVASLGGPLLLFDGGSLGVFPNGSFDRFSVAPGHHYLEAVHHRNWVYGKESALSFVALGGATYFFKIYPKDLEYVVTMTDLVPILVTGFQVDPVDATSALSEMSTLKDISSSVPTSVGHVR